jgi:chemotaxis protein MotB
MQTKNSLQLIREQLKQKNHALRKESLEKSQLSRKLHRLTHLNKEKIQELQKLILQKDQEIEEAKQSVLAARVARHAGLAQAPKPESKNSSSTTKSKPLPASREEGTSGPSSNLDEREKHLRKRLVKEQKALDKSNREKALLIKELRRIRKKLQTIDNLNEQIIRLKADLKRRSVPVDEELDQRIKEKDRVIENYEKLLQENLQGGHKNLLPSDIILDLKAEISELLEERDSLVEKLEDRQEYIAELEMKAHLHEEKDTTEKLESRMSVEGRGSAAAEFSSGLESFLVTYSDMITLILVIFVLLFTVSKVDENKFAEAFSSFQEKEFRIDTLNVHLNGDEMTMLRRVRELVQDNVDPETLVRGDVKTLLVRLKSADLFEPGEAELVSGAETLLENVLRERTQEGVKQIQVEGHTDDVPINTSQFPSNWELSTARAARVARFLSEKMRFPPQRLVVTGYGEFRPFKPNDSDQNRAMNRRVEIKILKDLDVFKEEQKKERSKLPRLAQKLRGTSLP